MKWTAAEALSWINHGVATPLRSWDQGTYSGIEEAQRTLRAALADGRVRARGRVEIQDAVTGRVVGGGVLVDVPSDQFKLSDIEVVVGVHGDMVTLPASKRAEYTRRGPCWRDLEFDAAEVKRVWPKPPSQLARKWMLAEAKRLKDSGRIGKREDLLKGCMKNTRCTRRECIAAYQKLPAGLRLHQGKPTK
jgi:hypothetical protein